MPRIPIPDCCYCTKEYFEKWDHSHHYPKTAAAPMQRFYVRDSAEGSPRQFVPKGWYCPKCGHTEADCKIIR